MLFPILATSGLTGTATQVYNCGMSAPKHWIPTDTAEDGRLFIPWRIRNPLLVDHPLIFLDHCWVMWFTADQRRCLIFYTLDR
jgi:hypothetical protein